jgi:CHAT domain-containing protein/Tfp pilus assembly protein PilF
LLSLAEKNLNYGQIREAEQNTNTALSLLKKYASEDKPQIARTNSILASVNTLLRKLQVAAAFAKEANAFYYDKNPSIERGNTFKALGSIKSQQGAIDSAFYYYNLAEKNFLKIDDLDPTYLASIYLAKGGTYFYDGQFQLSLNALEKALGLSKKAKKENPFLLTNIYRTLSSTYAGLEEFDKAISYLDYTSSIFDRTDMDDHFRISTLNNYGNILGSAGHFDKAIQTLEEAERLSLQDSATLKPLQGSINYNFGMAYYKKGDAENTIAKFKKAADIWKITRGEKFPGIASCYSFIGYEIYKKGRFTESKEWYAQALAIDTVTIGQHHIDVASFYTDLAKIAKAEGQYEEALGLIKKSYFSLLYNETDPEFYRNYISTGGLLLTLQVEADIHQQKFLNHQRANDLEKSLAASDKAVRIFDHLLSELNDPSSIKYLFDAADQVIEGAISTHFLAANFYQKPPGQKVFDLFEKSKDILILESLRQNNLFSGKISSDSLFIREREVKNAIAKLEGQKFELTYMGNTDPETIQNLNTSLFNLKTQQDAYKILIKKKYPKFAAIKYSHKTTSVKEIQNKLLSDSGALVEYFLGDSSIYVFTILKEKFFLDKIKKDFPLEKWINNMLNGIINSSNARKNFKASTETYATAAQNIYQKIVFPITKRIPINNSITIIPDGILGYIPFDALLFEAPQDKENFKKYPYLLNQYQISYAYSATLLDEMTHKKYSKEPTKNIVAFAPSFQNDKLKIPNLSAGGFDTYQLGHLIFNKTSVKEINNKIPATIFTDEQATKVQFLKSLESYRIIHLATHGKSNKNNGALGFLAFHPEKNNPEKALIFNQELFNLEINADMVVLSACETGIGELQEGEGIISLARGFSYAGAKSVITTLWSVNDKSSQVLMNYFYDYIKEGESKDKALRKAKINYIKNDLASGITPYYWAGIIPIGDMSRVELD